jgi:hypothetical protein
MWRVMRALERYGGMELRGMAAWYLCNGCILVNLSGFACPDRCKKVSASRILVVEDLYETRIFSEQ